MKNIIKKIKTNKTIKNALTVVVTVLVAVSMVTCLTGCKDKSVKLTDYITISDVKGCNGYGYVEYELDKEALASALVDDRKSENPASDYLGAGVLTEMVKVDIENNGSFSNGDIIKVVVSLGVDEGFDKKIVGGTITKKVSGLKEVKTLDLFKDFADIKFVGKNGNGKVEFAEKSSYKNDAIKNAFYNITYSVSVNENLSNGQKITVTATVENYLDTNKGLLAEGMAVAEEQTKELTVQDLWQPIERNQLTDEILKNLERKIQDNVAVVKIANVHYFWGTPIAGSAAAKKYENAVFAYVDYVNKNGDYKKTCYSFYDVHEIKDESEEAFADSGIPFYTSFTKYEKTTKQQAFDKVNQSLKKWYTITTIK